MRVRDVAIPPLILGEILPELDIQMTSIRRPGPKVWNMQVSYLPLPLFLKPPFPLHSASFSESLEYTPYVVQLRH